MARPFAESFYKSKAWERCRVGFMRSKHWECERCGAPATVAHHKVHLSPRNINDPNITLSWDNLMAVCVGCHAELHRKNQTMKFDVNGNPIPPGGQNCTTGSGTG